MNQFRQPPYFVDLLNSQQEPSGSSQVPIFSTQFSEAPFYGGDTLRGTPGDTSAERKERNKWSPTDDIMLISAWLNTSKDPVVGNEQKSGAFWKRIADYVAKSDKVDRSVVREPSHCKNRWQKVNDIIQKFCGSYAAATREKASGQNEDDVLKRSYEIYYNDHNKKKFTLAHAWRELRYDQKLFFRIVNELYNDDSFFRQKKDALGRPGLSPLQKCTAAIRLLAYGTSADAIDEYIRIGASTARLCLEHFIEGIINVFGNEYLRRPTPEDLQRLLQKGAERGFPGMIGSIDCMHWEWKNCPTAWKGQYTRGSAKPTIVLEVVASHDLWIWHAFFGAPDTLNDLNILDRSPVFDDIINGQAPPVNFSVNGNEYHLGYYLAGGIYPTWATFIPTVKIPQTRKQKLFAKLQEGFRKDVERAFGVLQARFAIIKHPVLFWDKAKIGRTMRACVILHNMIVEDERDGQYDETEFQENRNSYEDAPVVSDDTPTYVEEIMGIRASIRDTERHQQLKNDLMEHVWEKFGFFYAQIIGNT